MNKNINNLKREFEKIREMGYFEKKTNNCGEIGLNFEKLLGNTGGDFNIPDYNNIEIKCVNEKYKEKNDIYLFSSYPIGNVPFPMLELAKKYGYPDKVYNKEKVLSAKAYVNFPYNYGLFNSLMLNIDYKRKKIYLNVYDYYSNRINIDIYWDFNDLKEKLERKLKILALVLYKKRFIFNSCYYKYSDIELYNLIDFDCFLYLLEKNVIFLSIDVGVIKTGKYKGKVRDHGSSFTINYKNIDLLFKRIK